MKLSTIQIITSQFLHIIIHYKTYFIIALPMIIIYPVTDYFFGGYDFLDNYYLSLVISYFVSILAIINVHRFIILGEQTNFYNFNFKFKLIIKYFIFGILMIFIAFAPFRLLYLLMVEFEGITDFTSTNELAVLGIIFGLIILAVILILSLLCFFLVYPFFAFALPKIAVGEKFKFFEVWRETKGYRLTIFLQVIYIFLPYYCLMIYFAYFGYLGDYGSNFFNLANLFNHIFAIFLEILAISCLSKTYSLMREPQF